MKLHRVKLTNFRGVECREVTFVENGVTIIEGPNEVGKDSHRRRASICYRPT